ncbi:MAG: nicotinate-nicotinamide nucleotide adenylyltransferase [Myxococcales bacterium]|nr:nicotinate-nicotinamide nucleotide adenylyltransferase [Myxococcales bacterium]
MPEIALFGGSFDPPHVGHLLAAAYVLATEPIDELWLVPVFEHPLGKKAAAPFEHRVELCEKLAQSLPRTRVSRAEQESGKARTVDLLEWLDAGHPGTNFALVLGSDLDAERSQWKNFERIKELARIIELERGGYRKPQAASGKPVFPEVSSTDVRALLGSGGDVSHLVPRDVLAAIRAAGTYKP